MVASCPAISQIPSARPCKYVAILFFDSVPLFCSEYVGQAGRSTLAKQLGMAAANWQAGHLAELAIYQEYIS